MLKVPVRDIMLGDRARKDFGDLHGLSESIKRHGLIQPIVVMPQEDGKFLLIAGERRLRASVLAGISVLDAVRREDLTPIKRKELELEENLFRLPLNWTAEVELKQQIDELRREIEGHAAKNLGGWGRKDLANALDESVGKVSQDLKLARHLRAHPEDQEQMAKVPKTVAMRMVNKREAAENARKLSSGDQNTSFQHIDARVGLSAMKDASVDLILTDPPYGAREQVGQKLGARTTHIEPQDNLTPVEFTNLMAVVMPEFFRVLKPGRHMYMFHSPDNYQFMYELMTDAGFQVARQPLIWSKQRAMTVGTGLTYTSSYEQLFYVRKPSKEAQDMRMLSKHCQNLFVYPPIPAAARRHACQKPLDLLKFLIGQSTVPWETILDPFAGVASVLRAALQADRQAICFELSDVHYAQGLELLREEPKYG